MMTLSTGGGPRKWVQSPTQVAQAMGLDPSINPYTGAGGAPSPGGADYGFGPTKSYGGTRVAQPSAPMGQDYGFNVASAGGNTVTPGSHNVDGNGNQRPSDRGAIGDSTNGSDLSQFKFQGSDKSYSPQDIAALLANPQLFQAELLSSMGINNPTAMGAMGNFYTALPDLAAFYLAQQNGAVDDGDKMAGLYNQIMTNYVSPGGRSINPAEILNTLLGIGQVGSDGMANNQLQAYYAGTDPKTQQQRVGDLWGAAIGGVPGDYGDALGEQMARAQLAYQQSLLNANNGSVGTTGIPNQTFTQFLNTLPLFQSYAGR
jgi:hypothetical protein